MALARIIDSQSRWPEEYAALAARIASALGAAALRIDHVGSTSVPGLASKDVIDIQVTVLDLAADLQVGMTAAGFRYRADESNLSDHVPPGAASESAEEWAKRYFREPEGEREAHIHVRVAGRANQRYALLFRDYLRAHGDAAALYGEFKKRLASLDIETGVYAEIKDPVCDLIYGDAKRWATEVGWA